MDIFKNVSYEVKANEILFKVDYKQINIEIPFSFEFMANNEKSVIQDIIISKINEAYPGVELV